MDRNHPLMSSSQKWQAAEAGPESGGIQDLACAPTASFVAAQLFGLIESAQSTRSTSSGPAAGPLARLSVSVSSVSASVSW